MERDVALSLLDRDSRCLLGYFGSAGLLKTPTQQISVIERIPVV